MRLSKRRYFAFAIFSTITREAVRNPSLEIKGGNQPGVELAIGAQRLFNRNRREVLLLRSAAETASVRRLWLRLGLANLRRGRLFFATGEESLDHVKRHWNQEDGDP
jgi:hypothetical protein